MKVDMFADKTKEMAEYKKALLEQVVSEKFDRMFHFLEQNPPSQFDSWQDFVFHLKEYCKNTEQ